MKRIIRFFRNYFLFSLALVGGIASIVLQLLKYQTAAHIVLAILAIGEVLPLLWDMWQELRSGAYGIDILAATAIIASVILGQYWAALVVVLMLTGGQSLEDYAGRRAQSELDVLLSHVPTTANVLRKNKIIKVKVDDIKIGDKIIIKAGEVVPVDAVVIEGQANFDESSITGESIPVIKELGGNLLSGSISVDGTVTAKALATAADSQYQQIIKLVKSASTSQAPFVRLADRYSVPFTLTAYALAAAVWILSGHAIRFLEVIIVATPCPLLLATPIALISGMARASRYGIIVKNGTALEKLATAKTIAFDKTGTLTKGELTVNKVVAYGTLSEDNLLKLAASVEQNSRHVLAKAVINTAKDQKLKLEKAKNIEEIAGRGIKATIKSASVWVGGIGLFENNLSLPKDLKLQDNNTVAYIIVNHKLEGAIHFSDTIRSEAKATLQQLHKLGLKDIAMITGDHKSAADSIAKQLSIDEVYADQLPADKLHTLSKLKPKPVVFVGDGVNDAPVLTSASVGIALGAQGSTAASESADMVIMLDDLSRVAVAVEIAKKTFKIADQSIIIGIGLSFILMGIFATGKLSPITGAALQEVVDVVSIFNALRAHSIKPSLANHK
ncbi:MAG TPA: heavy metal translocating P-type ATPase [Candidatus Saccharimonadales bacterium]|nr:heavy metal translocating P-type ATPase [Candidatus Saccharimonadales bacterium]